MMYMSKTEQCSSEGTNQVIKVTTALGRRLGGKQK